MGGMKSLLGDTPLFDWHGQWPSFDGSTYQPKRDHKRLGAQYLRVWNCMSDGLWRSLDKIGSITGDPPASISARIRDFRKPKFGSHIIERRYVVNGLFEYRLVLNVPPA